jgi:hypothetical protein
VSADGGTQTQWHMVGWRMAGEGPSWTAGLGPAPASKEIIFFIFDSFSNEFKLILIQKQFSELENFEIKYGCEEFEIRNNFTYRNFPKLEIEFKLKIRENSKC